MSLWLEYSSVVQPNMHEAMKLIHNIISKNIFWSKPKAAFKGKFIVLNILFVRGKGKAHNNSSLYFKKLEKRDNNFKHKENRAQRCSSRNKSRSSLFDPKSQGQTFTKFMWEERIHCYILKFFSIFSLLSFMPSLLLVNWKYPVETRRTWGVFTEGSQTTDLAAVSRELSRWRSFTSFDTKISWKDISQPLPLLPITYH